MGTSPSVDCIFCAIIERRAPASIVYEDDETEAFLDIQPVTPGHVLVVPRRHAREASDLDDGSAAAVWRTGLRIGDALRRSGLKCDGVNFFVADGWIAGQEVFHFHLHVIPRFGGDGFGFRYPQGYERRPHRIELDGVAEQIRKALS